MKRPNLKIIRVEEELQLKGTENVFNKIIEENFPNLQKDIPMKVQEEKRTLNRLDQKNKSPSHIIIKTQYTEQRILRTAKEKGQVTYKGKSIRITPDFSMKTMNLRKVSDRCATDTKRPWVQAQTTVPSKAFFPHPWMEKTRYSMTKTDLNTM